MSYSIRNARPDESPKWDPEQYDVRIAEESGVPIGYLATRTVAGETEILDLFVEIAHRRKGIARALLESLDGDLFFLEVRESNRAARNLYSGLGFEQYGIRPNYYEDPRENAVLMRLSSALKRVKS